MLAGRLIAFAQNDYRNYYHETVTVTTMGLTMTGLVNTSETRDTHFYDFKNCNNYISFNNST